MTSRDPKSPKSPLGMWQLVAVFAAIALTYHFVSTAFEAEPVPYTELKSRIAAGKLDEASVSPTVIRWREKGGSRPEYRAVRVDDPHLLEDLQKAGVRVSGMPPSPGWSQWLWLAPLAFIFLGGLLSRFQGPQSSLMAVGRSRAKIYAEKDIPVRLSDVAGVDEAKEELQEVIDFLRTPERFARLGGRLPKGLLLVGPPGTGKTLLARAVAGQAGVPFFSISGSEFVEMFVGVGAARVRDLFLQAKEKAPCIIFIDELDALGKVRGLSPASNDEREQTLNQLLVEMDGFDPRGGVVLMAATNRPEILDPALLRAGRFDRHVVVDRPDKAGRVAILKVHTRKVPLAPDVDLEAVAAMTSGMVGADMANVVNEAALRAARNGKDAVGHAEFDEAVERIIAGLARKNRLLSPPEKARVASHEVGHALVAVSIPGTDPVKKLSLVPRGISALGYTIQLPTADRFLMTRSELENRIAVLLGGRAAEELVYGEPSTGAHDDLVKATDVARAMVVAYGMSERIGPISLEPAPRSPLGPPDGNGGHAQCSEASERAIDAEIRRIVEEQHTRALGLLRARLPALQAAARQLLEHETISGDELARILAEHRAVDAA